MIRYAPSDSNFEISNSKLYAPITLFSIKHENFK